MPTSRPLRQLTDSRYLRDVSNGLKELQSYEIVRRVHVEGDRRDHFVAESDLWEMLMRITVERKKREIDPTLQVLSDLSARLEGRKDVPPHIAQAYRVLVVEPGADRETTREAWIDLLQRYHPDHHQGEGPAQLERAREKTLEVQGAWEILDDWLPDQ